MTLLSLLSFISLALDLAYSIAVKDYMNDKRDVRIGLGLLAFSLSFGMTSNAIFTFKYWNISVLIEQTITGKDFFINEKRRNLAFYIFLTATALSPITYCILLGFVFFTEEKYQKLRPVYNISLVILYCTILGSYLLLADALRRIYKNLKDNTKVELNKTMMLAYLVSTILYFFSIVALIWLTIKSDYDPQAYRAIVGQFIGNFASYFMSAILLVIYWKILVNLPPNDDR
jgi:hypothetical protein